MDNINTIIHVFSRWITNINMIIWTKIKNAVELLRVGLLANALIVNKYKLIVKC